MILGQSPPSSTYNETGDGLPFFQGKVDFQRLHPIPRIWCTGGRKFADPGDILISVRAPVGDVNVAREHCGIGRGLAAVRSGPDSDPWFMYFALLYSKPTLEAMATGSTFASVNKSTLNDLWIPFFNRLEQAAIGRFLRSLVHQVGQEDTAIRVAQSLKRAAMQRLFTLGLRGEPQKETEIGPVPESWICNELGTLADITYGAQAAVANALDPEIGTLILTNVNLDLDGHINLEKRRYYNVPEEQREKLILRKGDILFNWRSGSANHVGKTVFFDLDGEYTYSSFILRLRPHRLILNEYLFRWLTYLRMNGFFTTQRNVSSINSVYNASLSATIPIWFPDKERQSEIVAFLDTIDRKIGLHRRKRTVLEDLFKALLHKLMTGEIRVGDSGLAMLCDRSFAAT